MLSPKPSLLTALTRLILLIGVVVIFFVIMQSCQAPKKPETSFAKGELAKLTQIEAPPRQPDLIFKGQDGKTLQLSNHKGRIILLNVWATWCPPCVEELPDLETLQTMRGGTDFEVIAVSVDRNMQVAQAFFDKNNIENLTLWHDETYSLPAHIRAPGLPVSIFYNRHGQEIGRISGAISWTAPEVLAYIDHLVKTDN